MTSWVRAVAVPGLVVSALVTGFTVAGASPASAASTCANYTDHGNTSGTTQANVPSTNGGVNGYNCVLGSGNTGPGVRALQRTLNYCYGAGLSVDSAFGAATKAALRRAQRSAGVSADGVYGPATRDAIDHAWYRVDATRDGGAFYLCATVQL